MLQAAAVLSLVPSTWRPGFFKLQHLHYWCGSCTGTNGCFSCRGAAYWEPAKYVAKLRRLKTNNSPVLLKVDFGAGHFSLSGRYGQLNQTALEYAFFMKCLGMLQVPLQPSVQHG